MTQATAETNELPPQVFQDPMHEMQFQTLNQMIVTRNDLVGRFNAATGDRVTLTEQIRENSTDPEIVAAREAYSEAYLALEALVKPVVDKIIADSQGATDELETSIKDLDAKLKPGLTYFKKMYGEQAAKYFTEQHRIKGAQIRSGASTRRIRGFNVIVTIDGESKEFDNAAGAAKHIGDVETSDLQNAFFTKAGVEASKDAPDSVELVVNFKEVDGDGNETEKEAFVKFYRVDAKGAEVKTEEPADEVNEDAVEESALDEDALSEF